MDELSGAEPLAATRLLLISAVVFAILCCAIRPGEVGRVADGRQMIFTAVAIIESGTLGQARNRDLTFPRAGGDAVSRYGMAMSAAQLPAAFLAPLIETRIGPGSSQWLFLVAPFVMVIACALIAARVSRRLGGTAAAQQNAVLLSTIASPFGVYAAMELSEPLQGLALVAAYAAILKACAPGRTRIVPAAAVASGIWIGIAVLTKSSLVIVAPLVLAPVLTLPRARAGRLLTWVAAGFTPLAIAWLYFEVVRFGQPFGGYAGEGFTHPFMDGAWRLLVGPNKGLLLYFPAAAVAGLALLRALRGTGPRAVGLLGALLPMVALLLLAAPWWAWHGVDGWGPRLLVPGIPLLAAVAAVELGRWRPALRLAAVILCVVVNVPPLFQHPTPVVRYTWMCQWPVDDEEASRVPAFARRQIDGRMRVPPDQILSREAAASPFRTLPWFLLTAHAPPNDRAARFSVPPWLAAQPAIAPSPPLSAEQADLLVHPTFVVYHAALSDQVLRAQQLRDGDRALLLARKLADLAPGGYADALVLESYRVLQRKADAIAWLQGMPIDHRQHPAINVVLALWDRDEGKEEEARGLLRSSAAAYPGAPLARALNAPLAAWPSDFVSMVEGVAQGIGVQ